MDHWMKIQPVLTGYVRRRVELYASQRSRHGEVEDGKSTNRLTLTLSGCRYMLLAERLRSDEEKAAMRAVLEEQVGVDVFLFYQIMDARRLLASNWTLEI